MTAPLNVAVQPAGTAPAENATVPANPLIGVTETVEVPATPAVVRTIVDGLADNEKSWIVTLMLVVLDSVLGAVPVVPVTSTLKGATPVAQLTDRTAPEKVAVQPEGTVPAVKVTVPAKPLIGVTVTLDVPGTVARVVIDGAESEKSWIVTWMITHRVKPPLVPQSVTSNGAIPVAHEIDRTVPLNVAVQPAGTPVTVYEIVPVNPFIGVTVTAEVPVTVASVVMAGADSEKSWIVTLTFVVLERVFGEVPVVPVTSTLNGATPVVQLTDKTAPENEAVQPADTVPAANVTVPVKPLIGVTVTVEVPATVARVVIAGADRLKS
jgi:hypothetical protein